MAGRDSHRCSLGLTGQSNSGPHLTSQEKNIYYRLRAYGLSHDQVMYSLQLDRDNRVADGSPTGGKNPSGPCGKGAAGDRLT